MSPERAAAVFESLTPKQHETLVLACRHLTSKQIALALGVAPVTIDKRIEAVRARLGSVPRSDLLRSYAGWAKTYDQTIDDEIILGDTARTGASMSAQPVEFALAFHDSIIVDQRAPWERDTGWLRPGINPSDLGVGGKLLFILGGAAAIMAVAVLCMAFADALMSMLLR